MGSGVCTPSSSLYCGNERKGVDGTFRSCNLSGVEGAGGKAGCGGAPSGISPPVSTTARCCGIRGKWSPEREKVGRPEKGAVKRIQ